MYLGLVGAACSILRYRRVGGTAYFGVAPCISLSANTPQIYENILQAPPSDLHVPGETPRYLNTCIAPGPRNLRPPPDVSKCPEPPQPSSKNSKTTQPTPLQATTKYSKPPCKPRASTLKTPKVAPGTQPPQSIASPPDLHENTAHPRQPTPKSPKPHQRTNPPKADYTTTEPPLFTRKYPEAPPTRH